MFTFTLLEGTEIHTGSERATVKNMPVSDSLFSKSYYVSSQSIEKGSALLSNKHKSKHGSKNKERVKKIFMEYSETLQENSESS